MLSLESMRRAASPRPRRGWIAPPLPCGRWAGGALVAIMLLGGCDRSSSAAKGAPAPPAVEQLPIERFREIAGGLDHADPSVRRKTIEGVSRLGPAAQAFVDRLKTLGESDPDPACRRLASETLAKLSRGTSG